MTSDRLGSAEAPLVLLNVSMGGALLAFFGEGVAFGAREGIRPTPPGLFPSLPGASARNCEIRWVDAAVGHVGVRFLSMDDDCRDALRRFVGNGFSGGDLTVGQ